MKRIFVLSFLAFSINSFAQTAKLGLKPGLSLEMATKIVTSNKVEVMGQSMETNGTTTIVQKFDVQNVNDTSAVIEQKIKSLQLQMDGGMGQNISFDSEKPEDMKSKMGEVLESSLKQKFKYNVNSKGIITKIDELKEKTSGKDDMMSTMLSQMNGGAQMPKVGDRVAFSILPDRELKKSDTWTEEAKADGVARKTIYTVKDITDGDIILSFTDETNINTKQSMMGMEADVSGKTNSTGEIIVDRKTGIIRQSTSEVTGNQSIEVQGQTIPNSTKMTVTTTVKAS